MMSEWKGKREVVHDGDADVECTVAFEGRQRRFKSFVLIGFEEGQAPLCVALAALPEIYYAIEALQTLYGYGMQAIPLIEQLEVIAEISEDTIGRKHLELIESDDDDGTDPNEEDSLIDSNYDTDEYHGDNGDLV